jgi:hypothetical protein
MNPAPATGKIPRFAGEGTNRNFYLPRLPHEHYKGDAVVHWTMPMAMRGTGWLNEIFHARFREVMLHASVREDFDRIPRCGTVRFPSPLNGERDQGRGVRMQTNA